MAEAEKKLSEHVNASEKKRSDNSTGHKMPKLPSTDPLLSSHMDEYLDEYLLNLCMYEQNLVCG